MTTALTCLSGTLVRQDDGSWQWSDGQPEPRIRDLSPDEWNFRCRTYGDRQCFVEVLRGVAQESELLAWVVAGARAGKYGSGKSGDHTGTGILDRAYALGWRPSESYKARDTGKVFES